MTRALRWMLWRRARTRIDPEDGCWECRSAYTYPRPEYDPGRYLIPPLHRRWCRTDPRIEQPRALTRLFLYLKERLR